LPLAVFDVGEYQDAWRFDFDWFDAFEIEDLQPNIIVGPGGRR